MPSPTAVAHPLPCLHSAASSSGAARSPSAAGGPGMLRLASVACPRSVATWHLGGSLLSVEWSCSPTFSPLLGEAVIDKLKNLHFTIQGLVSVSSQGARWGSGLQGEKACGWESCWPKAQPAGLFPAGDAGREQTASF